MGEKQNWTYCIVGNIKKTHYDKDGILRYGTAAFTGGKKCISAEEYGIEQETVSAL